MSRSETCSRNESQFAPFFVSAAIALLPCIKNMAQTSGANPLSYERLLPDFNNITPEAASLGAYGAFNSSEYTGSPNICFALCEAKSGAVSLPISLYYDASGVKADQEATFVGLGWNLKYGGSITHIVCGADDFTEQPRKTSKMFRDSIYNIATGYHTQYNPQSYHISWNLGIGVSAWSQALSASSTMYGRSQLMEDLSSGMHQPDIFHAVFCGHDVSFIIDKETNTTTVLNDNAHKYKIDLLKGQVWPAGLVITDDNGVIYTFKAFDETGTLDSYYLTEIVGLNSNDIITIAYQQYGRTALRGFYQSVGKLESNDGNVPSSMQAFLGTHLQRMAQSPNNNVNQVYPSTIESQQEKIIFSLSDRSDVAGGKAVSRIHVLSKNGEQLTHNILFTYGNFQEAEGNVGRSTDVLPDSSEVYAPLRLKLEKLTIDGKSSLFSYEESVALPYKTTLSKDFWGYYNGANNGKSLCSSPEYSITGQEIRKTDRIGTANRRASRRVCCAGILKRITHPTGGYSDFDFELHRFNDPGGYYYPCVESNVGTTIVKSMTAVGASKNRPSTESFTLDETTDVTIAVGLYSSDPSKYVASASIKCMHGNNFNTTFTTSASQKGLSKTFTQHLEPGTYIMWVSVPYIASDYSTTASLRVVIPVGMKLSEEDGVHGGYSYGGGVRIKSIKNYERDGSFLTGISYGYSGGCLLAPTARIETYTLNYGENRSAQKATLAHVGSQPSAAYFLTMNLANVGYSSVTTRQTDENNDSNGSIVREYANTPYQLVGPDMFYYTTKNLNGNILKETILSEDGDTVRTTCYAYANKKYEPVLFPRCKPLFLTPIYCEKVQYRLSLFPRANEWNYLVQTTETEYIDGKPAVPTKTTYSYSDTNYQPATVTTDHGGKQFKTRRVVKYADNRESSGAAFLTNRHCLSEPTGEEEWIGVETFRLKKGIVKHYRRLKGTTPIVDCFQSKATDGECITDITINRYDNYGNIAEYTTRDSIHTTLVWSYSYQYPILKIMGATYAEIIGICSELSSIGAKSTLNEETLKEIHAQLISNNNIQVTAYLYNPWYKVSLVIFPNGDLVRYDYDDFGRLTQTTDSEGNPQKRYDYHYAE